MENTISGFPGIEIAAAIPVHDSISYLYTQCWDPYDDPWDSIWSVRNYSSADIPFWHSYLGMADEDLVYRCRNDRPQTIRAEWAGNSVAEPIVLPPSFVGMHVSSMTWSYAPLEDVILCRHRVFPEREELRELFVSFYFEGGIGDSATYGLWRENDDRSIYLPDVHCAVVSDGGMLDGVQSDNCVGYRVLVPHHASPSALRWTTRDDFSRRSALRNVRSPAEYDSVVYSLLSSGVQMSGGFMGANWVAVGPFDVPLGDTLEFWTAEIYGKGIGDVLAKSALLDLLAQENFATPRPPPPPPLRIERAQKSLTLRWDARPGDVDPETYQDPGRKDLMAVPFEGYRVYRSTVSPDGPWTMVFECDIGGNGFGREFGLYHEYTETGLVNHATYYYAVTAFSKPDTVSGLPSRESPLQKTVRAAIPGERARDHVGEVAVVPNPYRTDVAYTGYQPPWERPTGRWPTWTEGDRRVQFINLPAECVISIYTLAGDLVDLLRHSDTEMSFHDWNLTSYVGQAVASGIYLFSVEDRRTGEVQVGKFVIIR